MNDIAMVQEVWRQQSPRRQIPLWALRAVLIDLPLARERYTLIRFFPHSIPASCAVRLSSCLREPVRFCHTLVQHCSAAAADQVLQPVSQQSVIFESDQGFSVLPAFSDVLRTAVLASGNRNLWHSIFLLSVLLTANTQYRETIQKSRECCFSKWRSSEKMKLQYA